jgi:phosphonate transport system substrate-binding protein
VRYVEEAGGEIILAKAQHGEAWYQSLFFTRKDSPIRSLEDLRGKSIAFEKPDSTSAYFLPVAMLTAAGLSLVELENVRTKPPANTVGYVFSGEESNSTLWVHKRLVDAAAYSDSDWQSKWIAPPALRDDLVVFARSRRLPRSVEIVSNTLAEPFKLRLKEILLNAPADPDAQAALKQYYNATAFSELTDEMRTALQEIRRDLGAASPGFQRVAEP